MLVFFKYKFQREAFMRIFPFIVRELNHQILSKDKYKIQQKWQLSFTKDPDTGTVSIARYSNVAFTW